MPRLKRLRYVATGPKIIISGTSIAALSFALNLQKQILSLPPKSRVPQLILCNHEELLRDVEPQDEVLYSFGKEAIQVLQKLGLWDNLLEEHENLYLDERGKKMKDGLCIWDAEWEEVLRINSQTKQNELGSRIRMSRSGLRKMLLENLSPANLIHQEAACVSFSKLPDNRMEILLDDGNTEICDLLVITSSATSPLKSLNPNHDEKFSGIVSISGNARLVGEVPAPADQEYGVQLSGLGIGVYTAPIDEHSAFWRIWFRDEHMRNMNGRKMDRNEAEGVLKEVLERGKDISEPFGTYVRSTRWESVRVCDGREYWRKQRGMEDGNVVVFEQWGRMLFPGAGDGLELVDGWELAEQLCKQSKLRKAVGGWEKASVLRGRRAIRIEWWGMRGAMLKGWWMWTVILLLSFVRRLYLH